MAANTISSAHSRYTSSSAGFSSSRIGVFMPKRNSMHGSAKYSTKAFSPGMALSGSTPRCAASQPHEHEREERDGDGKDGLHAGPEYRKALPACSATAG